MVTYSNNAIFNATNDSPWAAATHARYTEDPTREQVNWGSNSDPQDAGLTVGRVYKIARVEIHSWHTKLFLVGIENGKGFNSVSFEPADV